MQTNFSGVTVLLILIVGGPGRRWDWGAKPILGWAGNALILNVIRRDLEWLDGGVKPILGDNKPKLSQFFRGVGICANALECDGWIVVRERGNWVWSRYTESESKRRDES